MVFEQISSKVDLNITCPQNVTSYTNYDDKVSADIFRQVLTYMGFSGDNDTKSIFYNNGPTDPQINDYKLRMQNLFSSQDVISINKYYPLCENIVFTTYTEPANPNKNFFIMFGVISVIVLILFIIIGRHCVKSGRRQIREYLNIMKN